MAFVVLMAVNCSWVNASDSSWLSPAGDQPKERTTQVPFEDYAEVPHSMFEIVEGDLRAAAFKPLSDAQAAYYTSNKFSCKPAFKPYLVRGMYQNPGTGGFFLSRLGTTLFVDHSSLGPPDGPPQKSALVVCLDFVPTKVVVDTSGAI